MFVSIFPVVCWIQVCPRLWVPMMTTKVIEDRQETSLAMEQIDNVLRVGRSYIVCPLVCLSKSLVPLGNRTPLVQVALADRRHSSSHRNHHRSTLPETRFGENPSWNSGKMPFPRSLRAMRLCRCSYLDQRFVGYSLLDSNNRRSVPFVFPVCFDEISDCLD